MSLPSFSQLFGARHDTKEWLAGLRGGDAQETTHTHNVKEIHIKNSKDRVKQPEKVKEEVTSYSDLLSLLDLRGNSIGDRGSQSIASALVNDRALLGEYAY